MASEYNPFFGNVVGGLASQMASQMAAQQGFGQGIGGLAGALGGQSAAERMWPPRENPLADLLRSAEGKPKPKTIREELQLETDEWLKDTI